MWTTARGALIDQIRSHDCANALLQHFASWWYHHDPSRRSAFFGEVPQEAAQHPRIEQLWVSRPEMAVRRLHWVRSADKAYALASEEIVKPGVTYGAGRHQFDRVEQVRFFQSMRETRTEDEIQLHAWYGHGVSAMALLRPTWMLHGRRVVEEWDDMFDGVPVVRRRARRVIAFDDERMMGDDDNPTVMDYADEVVFAYDPENDVIRAWHDVWEGEPCTSCQIRDLAFDAGVGIGEPWVIKRIEDRHP